MTAFHESAEGMSDEWYTPREFFTALRLTFDLDPCSPGPGHWVPARRVFTKEDDGLAHPWGGVVWMNPPFGARNGHVPWLERFLAHGNGIAVVRAYTSAGWFHDFATEAEAMLFPRGKTQFVRGCEMRSTARDGKVTVHPAGSVGKAPGHGVVLLGMGEPSLTAMRQSGLGLFVDLRRKA